MVKRIEILTAINRLLKEKYPSFTVYIQACPIGFVRPSFLLEFVKHSQRDVSRLSIEKTVYFTITYYPTVDEYSQSEPEEMVCMQESILEIFAQGYVPVGDRAIKVQSSTGGMKEHEAYIDLQFEYFDNRTDVCEHEPLITSVTTRIQEV
jgi:hypothetical protein